MLFFFSRQINRTIGSVIATLSVVVSLHAERETAEWSAFHRTVEMSDESTDRVGPAPNDVTMRTLEFREVPEGSQMDPFQAVRDFHANRLEWTYIDFDQRNLEAIRRVRDMGVLFGGAGAASLHGSIRKFPKQPLEIHMPDLEGNPIVQPHMRGWARFRGIGDPSNPEFYDHHLRYYKKIVDWGAQTLHRDEPESPVFAAERYGGGFSDTGVAGFRKWLRQHLSGEEIKSLGISDPQTFDYREYLRERNAPVGDDFARFDDPLKKYWIKYWSDTTTEFWNRLIKEIKEYGGEEITFSANNSSLQMWEPYHLEFDFAISELLLETANPKHIWERSKLGREHGKVQVLGPPKTRAQPVEEEMKTILLRRVIATAYAAGMLGKVPWDVFDQSPDGDSRYFVKPEDVSDLYALVRSQDWEDYQILTAIGQGISEENKIAKGISTDGGTGGVYAFVQAKPNPKDAILIHLVDWGLPKEDFGNQRFFRTPSGERIAMYPLKENIMRTIPEPFTLRIDSELFDDPELWSFDLLRPLPYDRNEHQSASEQGDFTQLTETIRLPVSLENGIFTIEVPALDPWGILLIGSN